MDKEVLIQYCEVKEEIKDIRRRIRELDKYLEHPSVVSDTVTMGRRGKKPLGIVKISGVSDSIYRKKLAARSRLKRQLEEMEAELLELTCQAEEYIESIPKSELRMMFRLYFIDGYSYSGVAFRMNETFPNRRIKYTDENVKKKIQRFFENVPQCPD